MQVKQSGADKKGIFYIEEKDEKIAVLTYFFNEEGKMVIEHTVVNPGNEGKGLGKHLVDAAVSYAREKGFKIIPVCVYAKKVMERSDEYKDVLSAE